MYVQGPTIQKDHMTKKRVLHSKEKQTLLKETRPQVTGEIDQNCIDKDEIKLFKNVTYGKKW